MLASFELFVQPYSWLQNTTAKINQTGLEELPGDQPKIVKMGLAAEEAAVSTNVYWLDLVRFV